jgi:prepilin-type N-terminal cleavage/methylation domain-containing protein
MKRRHSPSGFTLIELVVSLAILGIMMTIGYSSLSSILRAKEALDESRDVRAISDAVLKRLSREIQLAVSGLALIPAQDKLEQPNSSKLNLIGTDEQLDGVEASTLTFLALEGGQYLPDGGSHSGIVQITYRVARDPDQGSNKDAPLLLIREEIPYIRPFKRAYEKVMVFPITDALASLSFQYFDPETNSWRKDWGTDKRTGLPRMIRLEVQLRSPRGTVQTYTTVLPLRSKT